VYRRSKKWARFRAIVISVMSLFAGRAFYLLGDVQAQQIGLVFFGVGINGLVTAGVYYSDWFQMLDESMKIITFIWGAPVVGTLVGYILDDWRGATFGIVIAVLVADTIAVPSSVYLHLRERREDQEYEKEMRKYGREP
jgi:Na+/phosphate symporter